MRIVDFKNCVFKGFICSCPVYGEEEETEKEETLQET